LDSDPCIVFRILREAWEEERERGQEEKKKRRREQKIREKCGSGGDDYHTITG